MAVQLVLIFSYSHSGHQEYPFWVDSWHLSWLSSTDCNKIEDETYEI